MVRTSKQRDRLWANLKRTWRYVRPCGWNLVGHAVVSIAEGVLGIFTPILSAKVILNLTGNMHGIHTILIVTHRLSTVVDSDQIFVVDQGKIIASGTHKQLPKTCSLYKDLYSKDLQV